MGPRVLPRIHNYIVFFIRLIKFESLLLIKIKIVFDRSPIGKFTN